MVRKQVYITDEQDRWLKKRSNQLGLSEAELIRRCLDASRDRPGSPAAAGPAEDPEALQALLAFAESRVGLEAPHAGRKFRREEVYEERPIPKTP